MKYVPVKVKFYGCDHFANKGVLSIIHWDTSCRADKAIFLAPLRIDLFLLYSNKGSFLIMFLSFILEKTTLTILVPGVPHGYHEKKFLFRESKLDVLVDSRVLITNIIMRAIKTLLFLRMPIICPKFWSPDWSLHLVPI